MIYTKTRCEDCIHKNVCAMLNRPEITVEKISENVKTDTNGLDIEVQCCNFITSSQTRMNRDFGLDCR